MILNLGAGHKLVKGAVNIDVTLYEGIDQVVDLSVYPWCWPDNSIDGIHSSHFIEHLPDQEKFIRECYRILKPGGFLRLCVPHSSSAAGIGCMGHYRTYSYGTLKDYLSRDFYMFGKAKFKTVEQDLNWWYEAMDCDNRLNPIVKFIIMMINPILSFLASLSPEICENLWCYWVGGFKEVMWKGEKI
jgi:SAM-dependent methyltransferase